MPTQLQEHVGQLTLREDWQRKHTKCMQHAHTHMHTAFRIKNHRAAAASHLEKQPTRVWEESKAQYYKIVLYTFTK